MNATASLAFPGSRALAGWGRQLAPYRPEAIWVGHLCLHRVEALVELHTPCRPDRFTLLLLEALSLDPVPTAAEPPPQRTENLLARLDARFHLGRPLLRQVLRELVKEGLVEADARGGWALTPSGHQALQRGEYPQARQERRGFHFVEPRTTPHGHEGVLHFLDLNSHKNAPWPVAEEWRFDPMALQECVAQPPEWKQRYGFPEDVLAVITTGPAAEAWKRVLVDRPERLLAVMCPVRREGRPELLGFAVTQEGWILHSSGPAFVVHERWGELFPELTAPLPELAWREAWRSWAQPRGLPMNEVESCALEVEGERLRVRAPAKLIERLRATRSDAIKGEAWLLAGDGPIRAAAQLELVASG
jgi:hypothetical protein